MNVTLTVFIFGFFVTLLVACGAGLTILEFRKMRAEIERGHGPHLADMKRYKPFEFRSRKQA